MAAITTLPRPGFGPPDIVCLSHRRWDMGLERPQHLMTRFARGRRVFFFEPPVIRSRQHPRLELTEVEPRIHVARPELPPGLGPEATDLCQAVLLENMLHEFGSSDFVLWYDTPTAVPFTRGFTPSAVVYDALDPLDAHAPEGAREWEQELLSRADLVFTDGQSPHETRSGRQANLYTFLNGVDHEHFAGARDLPPGQEPLDQAHLPHPRLGVLGTIDEGIDLDLVEHVAERHPGWQIVFLGPTAGIDPVSLPRRSNIHYLGRKSYGQIPAYLHGWQVGLLPLLPTADARHAGAARVPEYLGAGLSVVSTPIRNVTQPYGEMGLARIGATAADFVQAIEYALLEDRRDPSRLRAVEAALRGLSWDRTFAAMDRLLRNRVSRRCLRLVAGQAAVGAGAS